MKKMISFTVLIILICFLQEFGGVPNICKAKQVDQEISTVSNISDVKVPNSKKIDTISEQKIGTVVLDAGHGGIDGGSIGNGYIEKDITLSITKKIGDYLKKQNVNVIYTREDDSIFSNDNQQELQHRIDIAVANASDLFLSIHLNSSEETAKGFEVWTSFSNRESYEFANELHSSLTTTNYTQPREIKNQDESPLYVIENNPIPSILLELGFITSQEDMNYLGEEKNQNQIATNLADTIVKQLKIRINERDNF